MRMRASVIAVVVAIAAWSCLLAVVNAETRFQWSLFSRAVRNCDKLPELTAGYPVDKQEPFLEYSKAICNSISNLTQDISDQDKEEMKRLYTNIKEDIEFLSSFGLRKNASSFPDDDSMIIRNDNDSVTLIKKLLSGEGPKQLIFLDDETIRFISDDAKQSNIHDEVFSLLDKFQKKALEAENDTIVDHSSANTSFIQKNSFAISNSAPSSAVKPTSSADHLVVPSVILSFGLFIVFF